MLRYRYKVASYQHCVTIPLLYSENMDCENCGKEFEPRVKYCSTRCRVASHRKHESGAAVSENTSKEGSAPLTVSVAKASPFDTRPCKKHNGSFRGGCGCPTDD